MNGLRICGPCQSSQGCHEEEGLLAKSNGDGHNSHGGHASGHGGHGDCRIVVMVMVMRMVVMLVVMVMRMVIVKKLA